MTHMSNKNDNDNKYPAYHAPSPYANSDLLETVMTLGAFLAGLIGAGFLAVALMS